MDSEKIAEEEPGEERGTRGRGKQARVAEGLHKTRMEPNHEH